MEITYSKKTGQILEKKTAPDDFSSEWRYYRFAQYVGDTIKERKIKEGKKKVLFPEENIGNEQ